MGFLLFTSALIVSACGMIPDVVIDIPNMEVDIAPPEVVVRVPGIGVDDPEIHIDGGTSAVIRGSGNVVAETRLARNFKHISITGVGDVIITQGESESLVVETDDNIMQFIESEVRNGRLILGFTEEVRTNNYKLDPSKVIFNLSVKEITGLEISGVGNIQMSAYYGEHLELMINGVGNFEASSLETDTLEIEINGVANIDISSLDTDRVDVVINGVGEVMVNSLVADELEINLNGTGSVEINSLIAEKSVVSIGGVGEVELAGAVEEQGVFVSGVGDYFAAELESQTAMVEVDGGPNTIIVWVTDKLDVTIQGWNTVKYYGKPIVEQDIRSDPGKLINMGKP